MAIASEIHPYDTVWAFGKIARRTEIGGRITFENTKGRQLTVEPTLLLDAAVTGQFRPPKPPRRPVTNEEAWSGL